MSDDERKQLTELANQYRDAGEWDRLIETVEKRHALTRKEGMPSVDLVYLAGNLAQAGRVDEAVTLIERSAREFRETGVLENSFEWKTLYSTEIDVMLAADRMDDAIAACRKTVAIALATGPDDSEYWEMHGYLGDLLQFGKKDVPAAIVEREVLWAHFRKRIASFTGEAELAYNAIVVHVQNGARLAHAYRQVKRPAEAIPVYEALLLDIRRSTFLGPQAQEIATIKQELEATRAEAQRK